MKNNKIKMLFGEPVWDINELKSLPKKEITPLIQENIEVVIKRDRENIGKFLDKHGGILRQKFPSIDHRKGFSGEALRRLDIGSLPDPVSPFLVLAFNVLFFGGLYFGINFLINLKLG